MKQPSFPELLDKRVPAARLTDFIIHELSVFNLGKIVDFNFLSRSSVGGYCRSLGFAKNRNWSMLALDPLTSSVSISRLLSASSAIHPARPTNFVEGKKFRNYGDSRAGRTLETRTARASGA